jgi:hypothetical protein
METVLSSLWSAHLVALEDYQEVHRLPVIASFHGASDGRGSAIIGAPPHVVLDSLLHTLDAVPDSDKHARRAIRAMAAQAVAAFDALPRADKRAAQLAADQRWQAAMEEASHHQRPYAAFQAEILAHRRKGRPQWAYVAPIPADETGT